MVNIFVYIYLKTLKRTPLLLAIANNHENVVQHLLNEGAKLQCFDKENRSPFVIVSFFFCAICKIN